MIRNPLHRLAKSRTAILSDRDGTLETTYRELLELREQVRKAELAAAKPRRSRGQSPPRPGGKKA